MVIKKKLNTVKEMKKEDTKKTSSTSVLRSDEMRLLVSTGNIRLESCKMKHDPQIHLVCLNDGLNVEKRVFKMRTAPRQNIVPLPATN